jgi:peptidoglycan/xylan/chitin deacetylase (PgdA/CDA1 family)
MGTPRYPGFPAHADPRYFNPPGFRRILERAAALGYRIVPFRDFEPPGSTPVLLLRHDIDWSLEAALPLLELEADLGVAATVFVLTSGELYDVRSTAGRRILRRIADLGHEIGLHYEGERYESISGRSRLDDDLDLLRQSSGRAVVSAAQHLPLTGRRALPEGAVEHDAYDSRYLASPMHYVSDSLMVWRQATPHDLLDRRASFQFLSHPATWTSDFGDMGAALAALAGRASPRSRVVFDRLAVLYLQLLRDRETLDRRFRADSEGIGLEGP